MRNFSLKKLFLIVLIIVCAVAVFSKFRNDAKRQQEIREAIKECGGLAVLRTSDSNDPKSFFFVQKNNGYLSYLKKHCFGEDSISDVILIDLLRAAEVPQSLRMKIRSLNGVRAIFLNGNFTSQKSWETAFPDVVLVSFSSEQIIAPTSISEKQLSYWATAYPMHDIVLTDKTNRTKVPGTVN